MNNPINSWLVQTKGTLHFVSIPYSAPIHYERTLLYQHAFSPHCSSYNSYGTGGENFFKSPPLSLAGHLTFSCVLGFDNVAVRRNRVSLNLRG